MLSGWDNDKIYDISLKRNLVCFHALLEDHSSHYYTEMYTQTEIKKRKLATTPRDSGGVHIALPLRPLVT